MYIACLHRRLLVYVCGFTGSWEHARAFAPLFHPFEHKSRHRGRFDFVVEVCLFLFSFLFHVLLELGSRDGLLRPPAPGCWAGQRYRHAGFFLLLLRCFLGLWEDRY